MKVFHGEDIEEGLNRTLITLIPKMIKPTNIKDFYPITLFNVCYKIIIKVLANKLKSLMPNLISET